jgi:hypothetical protein
MRYLKAYNESTNPSFSKYVEETCDSLCITEWSINGDKVDVDGDVNISSCDLEEIPFKFGIVRGNFACKYNKLNSLEGCPSDVGGLFNCGRNQLVSLKGSPIRVGEYFSCSDNKLVTLEGGPKEVGGDYYCDWNQLTSLLGAPKYLDGDFDCSHNRLESLMSMPVGLKFIDCDTNNISSPEGIKSAKLFKFDENPIYSIYRLFSMFDDEKMASSFIESMDYNYIRGNNIVRSRFLEMCEEYDIKRIPHNIQCYNWI